MFYSLFLMKWLPFHGRSACVECVPAFCPADQTEKEDGALHGASRVVPIPHDYLWDNGSVRIIYITR